MSDLKPSVEMWAHRDMALPPEVVDIYPPLPLYKIWNYSSQTHFPPCSPCVPAGGGEGFPQMEQESRTHRNILAANPSRGCRIHLHPLRRLLLHHALSSISLELSRHCHHISVDVDDDPLPVATGQGCRWAIGIRLAFRTGKRCCHLRFSASSLLPLQNSPP